MQIKHPTYSTSKAGVFFAAMVTCMLAGCGGVAPTLYPIGGTVSGLTGTVVLQNNSTGDLSVSANGSFGFGRLWGNGNSYNVTVLTQPTGQTCTVSNGTGAVAGANVVGITVACVTDTFAVGGSVTGLVGSVALQNNGGDNLAVTADGAFAFATVMAYGTDYNITVLTQPAGQVCTVSGGAGTVSGVVNVPVVCL